MTEVFETYTMDYTGRIQHAQNKDGKWFRRSQYRDPRYGYKWSKWQNEASFTPDRTGEMHKVRLPR